MTLNPDVLTWCEVPYSPNGKWYSANPGDLKKPVVQPSDMCIVGLPYDAGQTAVSGQSAAPSTIRRLETFESWRTHDIGDLSTVKVVDRGDMNIDHREARVSLHEAMKPIKEAWANTDILVSLGGDHSITAALLETYAVWMKTKPVVIHLDAHTDTWQVSRNNSQYPDHASWVGWVQQYDYADEILQFGIRAMGPDPDEDSMLDNITVHPGALTPKQATSIFQWINSNKTDIPVYLSVDMDVVDPAFCPGVAYPEPGGWTSRELLNTIELFVAKLNIIGVDIVEITPSLDIRDMSVRLAHRSVLAVMRGIKRRQIR